MDSNTSAISTSKADNCGKAGTSEPPIEKSGRWHGDGNAEVLDVVNVLKNFGILSCIVGVGALKYYGAGRVLHSWEVCVPTEDFSRAIEILKSPPYNEVYEICPPPDLYLRSMLHAFPLFKPRGIAVKFHIVPSDDCHIDCTIPNIEYSQNGLPYPKLHTFAQALLDSNELTGLTDLIDGMDLDEAWGHQNLDLSGTNDVAWARQKNEKIEASLPGQDTSIAMVPTGTFDCAEVWSEIVNTKERRIGQELPKEYFSTRFYPKGWGDPRKRDRPFV